MFLKIIVFPLILSQQCLLVKTCKTQLLKKSHIFSFQTREVCLLTLLARLCMFAPVCLKCRDLLIYTEMKEHSSSIISPGFGSVTVFPVKETPHGSGERQAEDCVWKAWFSRAVKHWAFRTETLLVLQRLDREQECASRGASANTSLRVWVREITGLTGAQRGRSIFSQEGSHSDATEQTVLVPERTFQFFFLWTL